MYKLTQRGQSASKEDWTTKNREFGRFDKMLTLLTEVDKTIGMLAPSNAHAIDERVAIQ